MIHPSAIIQPGAEIDPSCEIGPYCVIGPHVKMGKNNRLMSHVVIDGHTTIGENNSFAPFGVIGGLPQDLKFKGEVTRLEIGNHNEIRESITINLGTVQGGGVTKIGDHNLLMGCTHFAHDVQVGNRCVVANGSAVAGHVIMGDYVTLGGLTGVAQFCRIGNHAYVAGHSGLERDVPPYCIVIGTRPTHLKGANIVGLRRRGFAAETISRINDVIKLWARPDIQKEQCLHEILAQYGEFQEIQEFVAFIRKTENGVVR